MTTDEAVANFRMMVAKQRKAQRLAWELLMHPEATSEQILNVVAQVRRMLEQTEQVQKSLLTLLDKQRKHYAWGTIKAINLRKGE